MPSPFNFQFLEIFTYSFLQPSHLYNFFHSFQFSFRRLYILAYISQRLTNFNCISFISLITHSPEGILILFNKKDYLKVVPNLIHVFYFPPIPNIYTFFLPLRSCIFWNYMGQLRILSCEFRQGNEKSVTFNEFYARKIPNNRF